MTFETLYINTDSNGCIKEMWGTDDEGYEKSVNFGKKIYLNNELVKTFKVEKVKDKNNIDLIIKRFKEEPNIPNALRTYKHSINDLENKPISFITSCFFLWYLDYFGEKPNGELDKIVEPHLEQFRNEHKEFKVKSNPDEETERCYRFIDHLQNEFSHRCPDIEFSKIKILCDLIDFIRNTYLGKIQKVFTIFIKYIFKPIIGGYIIRYTRGIDIEPYSYAYLFYLPECISGCKDILPETTIESMISDVALIYRLHNNHGHNYKKDINNHYENIISKLKNMKNENADDLVNLCRSLQYNLNKDLESIKTELKQKDDMVAFRELRDRIVSMDPSIECKTYENDLLYIISIDDNVYEKYHKELNDLARIIHKKYRPNKRIACFPHEFVSNYDTPINI